MLANFHTHTKYCDGDSTPEEIVKYAIDNKFDSLGFSGHGFTLFDTSYCMTDTDSYINEIKNLKQKYKDKIQIYLGIEEDAFYGVNRSDFDYIIGSSHYILVDGKYYAIDTDYEGFLKLLELYEYDVLKFSEEYYKNFCNYIQTRKPDIVGHFDLITKYDELDKQLFLCNNDYLEIAEKYIKIALKNDVIFEVNTGAISRGIRTAPYPHINLLRTIKEQGGKIILSSDSHAANTLDFQFAETKKMLKDIGFLYVYLMYDGSFIKDYL